MVYYGIPSILVYVTGPGKTGLIYIKYTCSCYGTYPLFCICNTESASFIEFLMHFCIYDDFLLQYSLQIKSCYKLDSQN